MEIWNTARYSIKGAFRMGQTTRVVALRGVSWLFGDRPPAPRLLRKTFERLGATYIKLGQFIASSPTLFPAEYVNEFQHCLDQTDPLPFRTIRQVLNEELGRPLERIFSDIDPEPLASASIAQVHAARLKTGEEVVIKIQKPGVRNVMLTDLNFLFVVARLLEWWAPSLSRASLSAIISEIQKTMVEECDFLLEASNIDAFDRFLRDSDNDVAVVPRVYYRGTSPRVLTMERFYGVPLTDLERIRRYSPDPEMTLVAAMNTWFSSLMRCDFFHADVHAGNLMVLKDGRVGFIDFGIVGRLSPEIWSATTDLIEGLVLGDYVTIARSMVKIGMTRRKVDVAHLALDIKNLYECIVEPLSEPWMAPQTPEQDVNRVVLDMVGLGERHGIRFPREFALLIKQFLYFDRYTRILAPEMNMLADERLMMIA